MGGKYLKNAPAPKKMRTWLKVLLGIGAGLLALILLLGVTFGIMLKVDPVKAMSMAKFVASPFTKHYAGYVNTLDDITVTDPTVSGENDSSQNTEPTDMYESFSDPTEETWPVIVPTENITTIMLVGQNYRESEQSYLSDTMIMCTINRETNTLTMTSILRDLYVPLPAYAGHGPGRNRINVCYHLGTTWTGSRKGGMEMLAACVEQNFGIPIDHTVEVDFTVFEKIVDMLGGVDIELTQAEADYLNSDVHYYYYFDHEFEAGPQTLKGSEALAYARIRAIDGDFQRTNRQRMVIDSLIQKCKTIGLWDLHKMATEILPMITTDMTDDEINEYIWEFLPMISNLNIVSQKIPLEKEQMNGDWSYSGKEIEGIGNVLEPNLWSHRKYLPQILGYVEAE